MAADKASNSIPDGFFESREEQADVIRSIRNKQDEEERRLIRERYRQIQDELSDQAQDIVNPADERDLLNAKLQTVRELFEPVQHTREAALDSTSLVNLSELGKKKAQALKTDFLRFNAADFCEKVRMRLSTVNHNEVCSLSHENWVTLGRGLRPFYKSTPVINFMFGSFERGEVVIKKKRAVREKEVETDSNKATKPQQLSSFEETDRGELTTAQVEHLLSTLWRVYELSNKSPICFFEFVTNPESYGQTVENIFYASFLVRDGHAKIFLDDDHLPVIEPLQKSVSEAASQLQSSQRAQVVVTLTPKEWREIVKTFGIETPVIQPLKQQPAVLKESNLQNSEDLDRSSHQGKGKGKGKKTVR